MKSGIAGKTLLIILLLFGNQLLAQTGSVSGIITDKETKEIIPFAKVIILSGNDTIAQTIADFDGIYEFYSIPAGKYKLMTEFIAYKRSKKKLMILPDSKLAIDIHLKFAGRIIEE